MKPGPSTDISNDFSFLYSKGIDYPVWLLLFHPFRTFQHFFETSRGL